VADEDHVRLLNDMGLAVPARALQVLEQVNNNLPNAIELLLASNMPFNPNWVYPRGFTH